MMRFLLRRNDASQILWNLFLRRIIVETSTMEKSIILSADILDILFEGRNKNYGAYDLRKTYNRRINYALAGTVFICLLFVAGSILASAKKRSSNDIVIASLTLENYKKDDPKPEPQKLQPKPEPKVQTTQYVAPIIVKDVKPEEEMKEVAVLEETKIGTFNQDGIKSDDVITAPVEKPSDKVETPRVEDDVDRVFTSVQIPAQFDGGPEAWRKYLVRNLNSDLPSQNGANAGSYTVIVSFIVDRTGAISDVKAENDPGFGTKAEAIRVIKKGPNWKPAIQNGTAVTYRHKQSITFRVEEQ